MKIKKFTVILLAALLCASAFSFAALATDGTTATASPVTTTNPEPIQTGEVKWEVGNKRYYGTFD